MKHGLITACLLGLSVWGQAEFLPATDDIPLMDGIVLSETTDFSFDTPAGQILTFDGTTRIEPAEVRLFYDKTLAALGWQKSKTDLYRRGADTFQLSFPQNGRIHFDIMLNSEP